MKKRMHMSRSKSKRDFRKKAMPHPKNLQGAGAAVMRGGYRL